VVVARVVSDGQEASSSTRRSGSRGDRECRHSRLTNHIRQSLSLTGKTRLDIPVRPGKKSEERARLFSLGFATPEQIGKDCHNH